MLHIIKNEPSNEIKEMVIKITKTEEWASADEENTELLRQYFDRLNKQILRERLVKEQHGLCAYCMKRIKSAPESMNIEHFVPIKGHKDKVLEYKNMLGTCKGGSDETSSTNRILCCDASKGDQMISIDPTDRDIVGKIRYNRDGRVYIYPEDPKLQYDIDHVLGLNGKLDEKGNTMEDTATRIVKGRRDAYRNYSTFISALEKKYGNNKSRINTEINKRIREIENSDEYPEYAGVTLYFLKRRVRVR